MVDSLMVLVAAVAVVLLAVSLVVAAHDAWWRRRDRRADEVALLDELERITRPAGVEWPWPPR